jgi:hypothetical protein
MKKILFILFVFYTVISFAQHAPDAIYFDNIKTVKLFQQNNQESMPIINLNSADVLELHFDDLDGYVKNYFYTFQLCNADWSVAQVNPFDYIKGFTQNRISQFRPSSITLSKYVHYQVNIPERNCMPTKSGNYLLKVFLNSDTNQLAFVKRMYVVESIAAVGLQVLQPFNGDKFRTHQRVQFSINTAKLNLFNILQQVKVVVMQNNRWDNLKTNLQPAFIRDKLLEYNGEIDCLFPASKEHRWVDMRSIRFESDFIQRKEINGDRTTVYVKPEGPRTNQRYLFYRDFDGWYNITNTDNVNPWWQTDYASVVFTYVPEKNQPLVGSEIHLNGELTGNVIGSKSKMDFNEAKGVYEKTLMLKQGFYSYQYLSKEADKKNSMADAELTEGNYWETENYYSVLVYYRSFSGRHDELVAIASTNSRFGRTIIGL